MEDFILPGNFEHCEREGAGTGGIAQGLDN